MAGNRRLRAAINGVTAAAMGEIAGAVFVLGRRALTDVPTWTIFAVTLGVVPLMKKVFEPVLILLAGIAGIAVQRMAT